MRCARWSLAICAMLAATDCSPSSSVRQVTPISPATPIQPVLSSDTLRTDDIASIEIVHGNLWRDLLGPARRRQLMDTLNQHRRLWDAVRPAAYRIRVVEMSHCIHVTTRQGPKMWPRLVIRDTLIVGREQELQPARYAQRCLLDMRVEDLFRDLSRALADTTEYVHDGTQFDPVYGFPRSYSTSSWGSRGVRRLVESFVPAP